MPDVLIYPIGSTPACRFAEEYLRRKGVPMVDHPTPEATHLLLDVPSFLDSGLLRDGRDLGKILPMLPPSITVIGGNLDHQNLRGYKVLDLLNAEPYLCENAAITAHCALEAAMPHLTKTLAQSPTLIIGWGRIGRCLALLLKQLGTDVTLLIRNEKERAMAAALGFRALAPWEPLDPNMHYRLLFNTAPETVLAEQQLKPLANCVKIDLASRRGLHSVDVIHARGLPGQYAPESAGELIARTVLQHILEE